MNKIFSALAATVFLNLIGCQDAKDDTRNTLLDADFYRTIGKEISFELGMRWLDAYELQHSSGRVTTLNCSMSAIQLDFILQSVADPVGIAFHYGEDESGNTHIIAIPVDESLSLWSVVPERMYLDTNSGTVISQATAHAWAQNYKNINPSKIWFHFFGASIFHEIQNLPFFNSFDIEPAFNDTEMTPEMLLIVWDDASGTHGRRKSESGTVYDASNACPPCAAK